MTLRFACFERKKEREKESEKDVTFGIADDTRCNVARCNDIQMYM